ncbi:MAG TPA: hypothetical protein VIA62_28920 [Thermoanaerobaculia bacterium]|nr:hypothetical protein [Thermoanaerobaculia bacterium]
MRPSQSVSGLFKVSQSRARETRTPAASASHSTSRFGLFRRGDCDGDGGRRRRSHETAPARTGAAATARMAGERSGTASQWERA